ncbi:MAG TPA: vitamin B12 dependent-methionine synthase activation domain-containing protein [Halanaerobiales bacterium]|nr:vitamin B12 dependent-methionine synthase activation domain-containing protein [Halanaerobiales bacterium]
MSEIIKDIPFNIDAESLREELMLEKTGDYKQFLQMAKEARQIAAPAAVYREAYIDEKGEDYLIIDAYRLESRLLRKNIADNHRVFLYAVTAGKDLESWARKYSGILEAYRAEEIQKSVLKSAASYLGELIDSLIGASITSEMNPGSLPDWPLEEQAKLFALLGDVEKEIALRLTDNYLMVPAKSISAIRFSSQAKFQNCQLCRRENCPDRRAPFSGKKQTHPEKLVKGKRAQERE